MRGGPRRGAGRPPLNIDPIIKNTGVYIYLPKWLADWVRSQPDSHSHLVQQALIQQHGLTAPVTKADPPDPSRADSHTGPASA